jgi:hypothetical protein
MLLRLTIVCGNGYGTVLICRTVRTSASCCLIITV